ncbi:MAG TPA: DUF4135 domain-containing protein [Acidobacteriaceae bacterium]|jgi:lantibiotic modifying enzyme|nr:DUF4135 domain-containing protein [Acidobacteriaceae bacterium]
METAPAEDGQLLVLGYQGTLQIDPAVNATRDAEKSPAWMEALVEPLLASAWLRLESRVPAARRVFAGEPIPFEPVLAVLRDRLLGILAQAAGAWCEATDATPSDGELLRAFPVLSSLLREAVAEWVAAAAAFLDRLHRDAPRMAPWLGLDAMPPIAMVSGAASDLHPGGHFVMRVAFAGGLCVYYKPRPVTGEWLWHELLAAVGMAQPELYLPAARVMAGGDAGRYGWAESVLVAEGSQNPEHAGGDAGGADYWQAAGALLCLAQHARLTDLHMGNVLATPSGPAVTDAECLATPERAEAQHAGGQHGQAEMDAILASLLDMGLLPRGAGDGLPDASGFFGGAGPVKGFVVPRWVTTADGRFRLTRAPAWLREHGNAPGGMTPVAVLARMMSGYRHAAEVLIGIRDALIGPGSRWRLILERLHAPRVVVRDTLGYAILLSQSLEAGSLRRASRRRSELAAALRRSRAVGIPNAVERAEVQALLHLHVPRFVMLAGTRTLANGSGRSLAHGFAQRTGADTVLRSIGELSAERLESMHIPALLLAVLSERRAGGST